MQDQDIVMTRECAKRTKLSPTLPREIILQIAQFLPDEASFFAYIVAFQGTTCGQGPIDALSSLERSTQRSDLWPNLELGWMGADEWELTLQAIPMYVNVKMHTMFDLHRLVGRVSPSTNLTILHRDKPDSARTRKWIDQYAQLPVRGLVLEPMGCESLMPKIIPQLCNVLPSMAYLRWLEISVGNQPSLESICKYIATSHITELRLDGDQDFLGSDEDPEINLEGVVWTHLVAWLHSTKVIRFDLNKFRLMCDDHATMQALNGALAASDAMQSIDWAECDIRISSPLVLPPRLQKVCLCRSTFAHVGVVSMLNLLPTMPYLTHVVLDSIPLSPADVDVLASVLAKSNVSYLDLGRCSIGNGGHYAGCIQRLAGAFEASASLRDLFLTYNNLHNDGVKAILKAFERRLVVTKMDNFVGNNFSQRRGELEEVVNPRMQPTSTIFLAL